MLRVAHPPGQHAFPLRWIFPWFLGMVLIAVVWALAIHTLTTPRPVAARLHPDAVVWGDRVFANRPLFAHWLSSRGRSYEEWAKKHPVGRAIISGKKLPATATATAKPKPTARRVAAKANSTSPAVATTATSPARMILAYFLIALVIAGLAFAPLVTIGAPFLGPRAFRLLASRVYVAAAAASAAIGLLASRV